MEPLRAALLDYFRRDGRDFPWRTDRDPYRVLVSEMMLQQTRAGTVPPYFERWMRRFPTIAALARATEQEVLKAWEGLGYYARALRLRRAAYEIVRHHGGRVPSTLSELRALPGVGPYTAGAVASIAYGLPVGAVDGNARRVLARLMDEPDPTDRVLEEWAGALVDPAEPGGFNQALMELGARICRPRAPKCEDCPISSHCGAFSSGMQEATPMRRPRRPVPEVTIACAGLICLGGDAPMALLRRRPSGGLLGGMWELPGEEVGPGDRASRVASGLAERLAGAARSDPEALPPPSDCPQASPVRVGRRQRLEPVCHEFTHRRVTYAAFLFEVSEMEWLPDLPGQHRWVSRARARELPMGVAQIRLLRQLL